jgi:phenylalanyl-tRNA synthetase beta chain
MISGSSVSSNNMNNLASYNWLKEYCKTDLSVADFARELSLRSMSVEKVDDVAARFDRIVIGLVNEVRSHPNADKLRLVTVNIGSETVEIVCGGVNVASGMKVCVALPGSKVRWHGEGDYITLGESEIRGVKSIGMICGAGEVGFAELEKGEKEIWDLSFVLAVAGTNLAVALELEDTVFDIEVTTNRPDVMGIVGLAREAAAAVGGQFVGKQPTVITPGTGIPFTVKIENTERCARQMAVVIDDVKVAESPWWLQKRLLLAGVRPINNIVDVTNYVLLEYAQPLHAFDYRNIEGSEIIVRAGKLGEKITALNGKEYDIGGHIVLADAVKPLDIAGIMGGNETGTTEATKTVVLSASSFDATSIRRTARALNLQSDAQLLFEKGLSTEALPIALARAVELILQTAGGIVASAVCDTRVKEYKPLVFPFRPEMARKRIGVEIADERMQRILEELGFVVNRTAEVWQVTVPFWRDHDIEVEVDFSEEIARMYGYHLMTGVLPAGNPPTTQEPVAIIWERFIKRQMAAAGYDEFFTYSFTNVEDVVKYGDDVATPYEILNPLVSEQSHLRISLIPGILRAIEGNQGHTRAAKFFEVSRVYLPTVNDLPIEETHLVFGEYGYTDATSVFRKLRGTLEMLANKTGLEITLSRGDIGDKWHATRSANIIIGGKIVGIIGEVSEKIQQRFGVDLRVFMVMLEVENLFEAMKLTHRYTLSSEFPAIMRDLSVIVDERVEFAAITRELKNDLLTTVALVDVYRGKGVDGGKKSLTLQLTLQATDKTLTAEEANKVIEEVGEVLKTKFGGILRS